MLIGVCMRTQLCCQHMTTKRNSDYVQNSNGARVPFDDWITMTAREQAAFIAHRGKQFTPEQRQQRCLANVAQRRVVITPLGEFASMTAAAKAHGLWGSNGIKQRIERGWPGYSYK